jgi:hypothetical protein
VVVPAYGRSRGGRVFRLIRTSEPIDASVRRYRLKAVPVSLGDSSAPREVATDVDATIQLDKLRLGQVVSTPESIFENLWEQLQIDLDLGDA